MMTNPDHVLPQKNNKVMNLAKKTHLDIDVLGYANGHLANASALRFEQPRHDTVLPVICTALVRLNGQV
jgi:hypothetical protein